MNPRLLASLALVLGATACGSLDANPNVPPVLATLKGQLLHNTPINQNNLRVAVIWMGIAPGQFNVAEDLPLPSNPFSFVIDIDSPPPASAMNGAAAFEGASPAPMSAFGSDAAVPPVMQPAPQVPSDFAMAIGAVVVYIDENGNGKLDLVPEDAGAFVDKIIAANQDMMLTYIQGSVPPFLTQGVSGTPSLGYDLLYAAECMAVPSMVTPTPGLDGGVTITVTPDAGPCSAPQWFGMDALYNVTVTSNPQVSALMCQSSSSSGSEGVGPSSSPGNAQPAQYPAPGSPGLACASDGSSYTYTTCTTQGGVCSQEQTCTSTSVARPTPVPAGWPCP
jgi:hypothetical protein